MPKPKRGKWIPIECETGVEAFGYKEMTVQFVDSVQWEFDSETLNMKVREKAEKRPDLDYTLTELDERIRKVVPEGTFKPYRERYGKFGGKGSWCE